MSDGAPKLGFGIFVSLQLALLVLGGYVVMDAKADAAWGWDAPAPDRADDEADGGNNTTAKPVLVEVFGTDIGHTQGIVAVAFAQAALLLGAAAVRANTPPDPESPRAYQSMVARQQEQIAALKAHLHETQGTLEDTHARLVAERAERARIEEGIPPGLVRYYRDGQHLQNGNGGILRAATRERRAWEALSHTLHTGAVAPLLTALAAVPEDHAAGTHHYSTEEVVDLLVRISAQLRENDWMSKALRWAEAKYGSS